MNKLEQEEKQNQELLTITRRSLIGAAILGAIGGIMHITNHENEIKIYDLNMQYSHMKPNFDTFILDFSKYNRFPRYIDTLDSRILEVPTGKGAEKYTISLVGNELTLSLSSQEEDFLWKYDVSGLLWKKEKIGFREIDRSLGEVQDLIKQQYPNF